MNSHYFNNDALRQFSIDCQNDFSGSFLVAWTLKFREISSCEIAFSFSKEILPEIVQIEKKQNLIIFTVNDFTPLFFIRLSSLLELFSFAISSLDCFKVNLAIGDFAGPDFDGVAMSSSSNNAFLVPDVYFISTRAYQADKKRIDNALQRIKPPLVMGAYWRGSLTGELRLDPNGSYSNHRINLCRQFKKFSYCDFKITNISQARREDQSLMHYLVSCDIFKDERDQFIDCLKHFVQVDVDGNGNAWNGLFLKLYSGRPVIKASSPKFLKQWYYDRLVDGIHFFSVEKDFSDLDGKLRYLLSEEGAMDALSVGSRARELMGSLTYQGEMVYFNDAIRKRLQ